MLVVVSFALRSRTHQVRKGMGVIDTVLNASSSSHANEQHKYQRDVPAGHSCLRLSNERITKPTCVPALS
jgi:hypothetical protein